MSTVQYPGGINYPTVVTNYGADDAGATGLSDTESQFNLDGPVDSAVIYTLPGLPYDVLVTPPERLLTVDAAAGGSAVIGPPDYGALPVPALADFRGIFLRSLGDFARVRWAGFMWTIVDKGGPTISVAGIEQNIL